MDHPKFIDSNQKSESFRLQRFSFVYIQVEFSHHNNHFIWYLFIFSLEVKHRALEIVGTQLMICQGFAVLEVIHPMVGIVKTGVVAPLMQVY